SGGGSAWLRTLHPQRRLLIACDKLQHHAARGFPILRRTLPVIVVNATESGMNRDLFRHALVALTFFILTCSTAAAQSISGVVKDTSDAVLPGVTVDATNSSTQQVRST